jgi:hypothetical protein
MRLTQLVYTSRPFGFDEATLDDILLVARQNNQRHGLTGALIVRADLYVQLLEGARDAVTSTFARIAADDRHLDVSLAWCGDIEDRMFPDWAMRDDPARSWLWTVQEVRQGAVRNAPMAEVRGVFARLAAEHATA